MKEGIRWLRSVMASLAFCLPFRTPGLADDARARPAHRLVVGWDDAVIVCGPGTNAGMDSPQAIQRMVKRWTARGYQGIYWRVDEAMLPEQYMTRWHPKISPSQNYLLERVDQKLREFPVLKTLLSAAEREGLEVWAWYPTIYSNGAPPVGPGFTHAWLYENKFGTDHPEILSVDRAGNKHYMVWEYAYPEARRAKVSEFVQFARDYGFQRFVACLRTEAAQMQPAPKHADQFGFNAPVVEEMKRRYNVDILADPRFDYAYPKFDVREPMVENWRKLRAEYLTQFYRELRQALNKVDPRIQIAVQIPGDRAGTCLGNWHLDWRTWIDEGLVNELVLPVVLDGYEGYGARANPEQLGYLDGHVSIDQVRDFIQRSRQPTARVIQAGGPATSDAQPTPGADGWRLDGWFDLWCYNMAERWEQWADDVAQFGHVKFIEQAFDGFPDGSDGYGGGFGDFCHRPDLRSCPGYWETLGDGSDERPHAQSRVRRGATGRAMQLTRDAQGRASLSVRHHSRHDRGAYPFPGDTAISSGACQLEFWIYRPDAKSAFVAYQQYDFDPADRANVGLYVAEGQPGPIYYRHSGKFAGSTATMATGRWHRVTVQVDLERKVYSAEIAADGETAQTICRDVPYTTAYNAFNRIEFSPQGATGSELYLDDVSLRWTPVVMPEPRGPQTIVRDGFESSKPGSSVDGLVSGSGACWSVREGQATDICVDSDISYGHEYQSLRFRGAGGRARLTTTPLTWQPGEVVTLDLDVFLRSDALHVQLVPAGQAVGTDEVGFALRDPRDDRLLFELRTVSGAWRWEDEGHATDTRIAAAFDAWYHLQLVLDSQQQTCRVTLQVIGEVPRELFRGTLGPAADLAVEALGAPAALAIELFCLRKRSRPDGPAFDNLLVTGRTGQQDH